MRPACAVCLVEFAPGEKFAIKGTYVVHRNPSCVNGTAKVERDVRDLMEDVNSTQRQLDAERMSHKLTRDQATYESSDQQTRISNLTVRVLATEKFLGDRDTELRAVKSTLDRERSEREGERLRHALALQQAQMGIATTPEPEISSDTKDDTEQRFSLLELD